MAFLRIRSHRSEWKARRRAVEDELARADQEQRQAWINATRVPEQWTPDMLDRLGTDLRGRGSGATRPERKKGASTPEDGGA